jgi:hypothetical protein
MKTNTTTVAKVSGMSELEIEIALTEHPTQEQTDAFLARIREFPENSLERYYALGMLLQQADSTITLPQIEELCRMYTYALPQSTQTPHSLYWAIDVWIRCAYASFNDLLGIFRWLGSLGHPLIPDEENCARRLRIAQQILAQDDLSFEMANRGEKVYEQLTCQQLKIAYGEFSEDPACHLVLYDALVMWEETSRRTIEQCSDTDLQVLHPHFADTPPVRAVLIRKHAAVCDSVDEESD